MKKILFIIVLLILCLNATGCVMHEFKQFETSLREGLFQGKSELDNDLTISIEFSEIDQMEYMNINNNKTMDLASLDIRFNIHYYVNIVLSKGNENYVVEFSEMLRQNSETVNTYKVMDIYGDIFGRELDLSNVYIKLIDSNNDKIVDELEVNYKLGEQSDTVNLKYVGDGKINDFDYHHRFEYNCTLTYDGKINFINNPCSTFLASKRLIYTICKIDGYKVVMYVNDEPYAEVESDGVTSIQFEYVTGYSDVIIEFKSVEIK